MKTILIMRHGKANDADPGEGDFDRTLHPRGRVDTARMGRHIAAQGLVPTVIVCSSAERARETTAAVTQSFDSVPETVYSDDLYVAAPQAWLDELAGVDSDCDCVLLIGHNPTMEALVAMLTGAGAGMSTATVARVEVDADEWRELAEGASGTLIDVWRPGDLPDTE